MSRLIDVDPLPWLHGGDIVARQLAAFGIENVFTLTGGHISGIFDGCGHAGIRLVDFRHEQAAVHAAEGFARVTRSVSATAVTAGPGVTNAITGIANACYAETPMIVLGGRNPLATDGAGNLQDAPHLDLVRPVTRYASTVYSADRISEVLRDAYAAASSLPRGPAFVDVPIEVQLTQIAADSIPTLRGYPDRLRAFPDPDRVREAAALLGAARQPVVLVGSNAYWDKAEQTLDTFARTYGAPVFLNGAARGLLGRGHPFQARYGRTRALLTADLILVLGAEFDFRLGYGQPGTVNPDATIIQVHPNPARIGQNRRVSLGITSNIDTFLTCLMAHDSEFGGKVPSAWAKKLTVVATKPETEGSGHPDSPVHPTRFCAELARFFGPDFTVIGDGGDIVAMLAGYIQPGGPGQWMDPGPFGCLGVGAPFAIGARLARPSQPIAVVFGDGSFGFNAFELDTAVRLNLPFVGIIGNDGAWGEMRTFQEDIFGPGTLPAQYLSQKTQYEKVAEGLGAHGERVERESDLLPALERAFKCGGPAIVNVILDPKYRNRNTTISGRNVAQSYGNGDINAFKRQQPIA